MRLRARLLVFVTATSIGLIVGLYMLSSTLLVRNYAELERQYAVQDVERASRAFWQLADDLHVKASDWAEWDDTYRFLADRNPSYIQSNLLDDTLVKLRLDLLLYADNHGKLFYARSIRRLKDVRPPEPAAVL